jgi:hypothetical protein
VNEKWPKVLKVPLCQRGIYGDLLLFRAICKIPPGPPFSKGGVFVRTLTIDFHVNNGTKIAITLDPLTFILSPVVGGEGRVRGM